MRFLGSSSTNVAGFISRISCIDRENWIMQHEEDEHAIAQDH